MRLHILGSRGSIPTGGEQYKKYGSDTSCYLVEEDCDVLVLDAGTGLLNAPSFSGDTIDILLTHLHIDHLLGLCMFPELMENKTINIYSPFEEKDVLTALEKLMSPPLWPCNINDYNAEIKVIKLEQKISIGSFTVDFIWGNHPGKSAIYRIDSSSKSIVYATDFECETDDKSIFTDFANGSNLILIDGQYTPDEFTMRKGFGHSSYIDAISLANECDCKKTIIIHHDPKHDDLYLEKIENEVREMNDSIFLAHQKDLIEL